MGLKYLGLAVAALTAASSTIGFAEPRTPPREIVRVKGDLYRAGEGNWYTVFLVTPAGIILGDPINENFAPWLKGELDRRFPGRPVRYVVYSHSHFDHASGGAVFAATATFVGHVNMLRNMDGRYPQMPGDMVDRNHNGVIDRDEIDIPTNTRPGVCGMFPGWFDIADLNNDGKITPQELQQHIVRPTIVYNDRMRIELGGKVVELVHPGLNHSDDATVMVFPGERAAFATEFIADALVAGNPRSLPSACGPFDGSPLDEWIKSYRAVEALEFDVLVPGHGSELGRQDAGARDARVLRRLARRSRGRHGRRPDARAAQGQREARALQELGELRAAARVQRRSSLPQPADASIAALTGGQSAAPSGPAAGLQQSRGREPMSAFPPFAFSGSNSR